MALPILGPVLGVLGSLFFRKVTETVAGGDDTDAPQSVTRRKPRALTIPFFYTVGAVCAYHYILYPIITYHWPHYNFPPIDAGLINVLLNLGSALGGAQ